MRGSLIAMLALTGMAASAAAAPFVCTAGTRRKEALTATAPLPGGGFLAAGTAASSSDVTDDAALLFLDAGGRVGAAWTLATPGDDVPVSVAVLADGRAIVAGNGSGNDCGVLPSAWLAAVDPVSGLSWQVALDAGPSVTSHRVVGCAVTDRGRIAVAGGSPGAWGRSWIASLAQDGSLRWAREIPLSYGGLERSAVPGWQRCGRSP